MALLGSPPLLCSFALGRGRYCTKLHKHRGDHGEVPFVTCRLCGYEKPMGTPCGEPCV